MAKNILASQVMRHLEISHLTDQRWRIRHEAMRADDVARLKTLEQGSAKLKRMQRLWRSEGLHVKYRNHYRPHSALAYLTPVEYAPK